MNSIDWKLPNESEGEEREGHKGCLSKHKVKSSVKHPAAIMPSGETCQHMHLCKREGILTPHPLPDRFVNETLSVNTPTLTQRKELSYDIQYELTTLEIYSNFTKREAPPQTIADPIML